MERATQRVIITDDFGRSITRDLPTPGHFNYIEGAFSQIHPEYKGPLKVEEVDKSGRVEFTTVCSSLGALTEDEFENFLSTGTPPQRN